MQPMRLILLALALLAATASTRAQPASYVLDPTHSFVHFELLHFDTSTIRGRFGPLNGEVVLDRSARSGRVQVVVATAAVSTGLPLLDTLIKQPELLAVADHPQAFFVAERMEFDAQGQVIAVTGEFTLRGIGQSLRLVAQRFRCYFHPLLRREVCGGDFEAEFLRSRFGITHSLPFVADRIRLKVQVEAIRQDP
ncbi:MAG: polyisoprenoid-binding protein [Betaproteobacteria bacterium]|nr:polyisoprenoid-binding protein [Betaproteobacteria bacterium]